MFERNKIFKDVNRSMDMSSHGGLSVFALGSSRPLGERIASYLSTELRPAREETFPDGEMIVSPDDNVRGSDVFVIQSLYSDSTQSVNDRLMALAIFNNAAYFGSATRVVNVIPYLSYLKQDRKTRSREPLSAKVVAHFLTGPRWGADRILGLDWHSDAVQNAYDVPVDILSPNNVFIDHLRATLKAEEKIVVLAPDVGAAKTRTKGFSERLSTALGRKVHFAITEKTRKGADLDSQFLLGDVKDAYVIITDDESVSGSTLVNAAKKAKEKGAKTVVACMAHAKFNEDGIKQLETSPLELIVATDSVPQPPDFFTEHRKFKLVGLDTLLGEAIRRIHNDESVSSLFKPRTPADFND